MTAVVGAVAQDRAAGGGLWRSFAVRENLELMPGVEVPVREVQVETSRASGPGGQHVNRTESRVTLRFNLRESPSIPEEDRQWMCEKLDSRLTRAGEVLVSCERYRDRLRNLEAAFQRLEDLLRDAIARPKKRRRTRRTKASVERRLEAKRRRSAAKRDRRPSEDRD